MIPAGLRLSCRTASIEERLPRLVVHGDPAACFEGARRGGRLSAGGGDEEAETESDEHQTGESLKDALRCGGLLESLAEGTGTRCDAEEGQDGDSSEGQSEEQQLMSDRARRFHRADELGQERQEKEGDLGIDGVGKKTADDLLGERAACGDGCRADGNTRGSAQAQNAEDDEVARPDHLGEGEQRG